jgi:UDP-N-acetylglucosamine pyrophosphorylase
LNGFSLALLRRAARAALPLHAAHKAVAHAAEPSPAAPNAYKFERFVFDAFALAGEAFVAVRVERARAFAPLKRASDAPLVRAALSCEAKRRIRAAGGRVLDDDAAVGATTLVEIGACVDDARLASLVVDAFPFALVE